MTARIVVRALARDTSEERFVRSSWVKSQRSFRFYGKSEPWPGPESFALKITDEIERGLAGTVLIAHAPDDEESLYGFIASDGETLHYAYVKKPFRGLGIARALWVAAGAPRTCTSRGFAFDAVKDRYSFTFARS